MRPQLILVSGFLGAGKTTLIVRAAELLLRQGIRVAVITNDQDRGLVDTRFTEAAALPTREVPGGCFCCRFSALMDAAAKLKQYRPAVIFAEPVGSCVDLSATILQPLKASYVQEYAIAPLTVLVDPHLAGSVFAGQAAGSVSFLFQKQLAEADLVCVTKTDRYGSCPALPVPADFHLSAVTGEGIQDWLEAVRSGSRAAGARLLDVDYARYAEAEAALGWVNLQARAALRQPLSPAMLAGPLTDQLEGLLSNAGIAIAHLKVFDRCPAGFVKVSVCHNGDDPRADGDLAASADLSHELAVNLRAVGPPDQLLDLVSLTLHKIDGEITVLHAAGFRPAPPKPQYRFEKIASG